MVRLLNGERAFFFFFLGGGGGRFGFFTRYWPAFFFFFLGGAIQLLPLLWLEG